MKFIVCFPYEFTLLSNITFNIQCIYQFVSPTNLHCSQTKLTTMRVLTLFVSPTNLHCSQTAVISVSPVSWFVSPTNLHCSQTNDWMSICNLCLFPLRIYTALKRWMQYPFPSYVCFPYEFTLLSNDEVWIKIPSGFVSPTNLHCSQTGSDFYRSLG